MYTVFTTDEFRENNLRKLAEHLLNLPDDYEDFDMSLYMANASNWFAHIKPCGTAACAGGHGPIAGIEPLHGENWMKYSLRCFIEYSPNHDNPQAAWEWCFGSDWCLSDNTPKGAAKRILTLLEKGVPDNYCDQMIGDAELCYT